jgi:hypothetical protein
MTADCFPLGLPAVPERRGRARSEGTLTRVEDNENIRLGWPRSIIERLGAGLLNESRQLPSGL